jgi:hypothetical protein
MVRVGIATQKANATIHEWVFIWPNMPNNKTGYRRTAMSSANNYYNSTLTPDVAQYRWLCQNESLVKITYTSANPISLIYETNRVILPSPYPKLSNTPWNISSATPWTGAGNNLTGPNPTERVAGPTAQLTGFVYWKPTT